MNLTFQFNSGNSIIDSFIKPCFQGPSEILSPLFGCHQQLLLDDLRGRRALGCEDELEVADDLIDNLMVFDN